MSRCPRRIAQHYARRADGLLPSLLGLLPLDWAALLAGPRTAPAALLLRSLKSSASLSRLCNSRGGARALTWLLLKLGLCTLLVWHWTACLYLYVLHAAALGWSTLERDWLVREEQGWAPPALLEAPLGVQYTHAVTWAVGILWGIAQPEPETVAQQLVGLLVMVSGVVVSAMVVGTATTVVADMHAQASATYPPIPRYLVHPPLSITPNVADAGLRGIHAAAAHPAVRAAQATSPYHGCNLSVRLCPNPLTRCTAVCTEPHTLRLTRYMRHKRLPVPLRRRIERCHSKYSHSKYSQSNKHSHSKYSHSKYSHSK